MNHFGQRDIINQHIGKAQWLYQKGNTAIHRKSHFINKEMFIKL